MKLKILKRFIMKLTYFININDKAPDPAVIETAEEDHKEVPNGLAKSVF